MATKVSVKVTSPAGITKSADKEVKSGCDNDYYLDVAWDLINELACELFAGEITCGLPEEEVDIIWDEEFDSFCDSCDTNWEVKNL